MDASPVYLANLEAYYDDKYKIIVNQGGTRSGKTYSIMQFLIMLGYNASSSLEISVVSHTLPHIKKGVKRDFEKITQSIGIFEDKKFNKTDLVYRFTPETYMEFFSADDGNKLRGTSRDILFINEANLLTYDEWKQLLMRTRGKIFIDYNPSEEYHWIYDYVLTREDVKFIKSTYLDNYDYLPIEQIEEIERLKDEDNNYWQIYGLGEVAQATNLIYPKFQVIDTYWDGDAIYGLDFGFNNQTALVKMIRRDRELFLSELIYESHLTNSDLIQKLKYFKIGHSFIYADAQEPQRIEEIYRAGFNIHKADKAVKPGIDFVKRFKLNVHCESTNIIKELKSYKWKEDRNGNILDEPVKFNDHLADGIRYGVFTHGQKYWINAQSAFPSSIQSIKENSIRNKLKSF
ncbi:MAG: PBSX family phage terminase large subunit [Candidatus Kapabacteria bacterium]|nr:PBSX family phage terminase large subunit [Ignavibacteriota bacterium]MCW5886353.1 PBSX family phage terminase large subunit [Candidatus Kapabacteria bacterium]